MTTFFSKTGRRHTGIPLSARFSTSTCQTDGLGTLDKMTRCFASAPPPRSPDLTVCDFFLLGVREGQNLRTPTTHNRGWAAGTHRLGHTRYAAESLVRARLSHRCLPRNKRALSVCHTTWNCMRLCSCNHQFCKNIPVSFDIITTWNQRVFLCSPFTFPFHVLIVCNRQSCIYFHFSHAWHMQCANAQFVCVKIQIL